VKIRLLTLVLTLWLCTPAWADKALVVGVDHYPDLRGEARLSGGANDARLMAEKLGEMGFEVVLLTEEQATRQGILAALAELARSTGPQERFVFYFAGHGTEGPRLLPFDSQEGTLERDIDAQTLNQAVLEVPAAHRTVLLDACFSETFLRSKGLAPALKARYYRKEAARSKGLGPQDGSAQRQDSNQHFSGASGSAPQNPVCYFVACRQNELAVEDGFEGQVHGVFTYYLASRLLSNRPLWGDLQMSVAAEVSERTGDQQHPTLTPGYGPYPVLAGPGFGSGPVSSQAQGGSSAGAPEGSWQGNLWELFNRDNVDRERLSLRMEPDSSTVKVGDLLGFSVQTGCDGYLIIVEHGVSGQVHLLYPSASSVELAWVRAGQTVSIPPAGLAYTPDRPGTERVRALLFSSRPEAQRMLAVLGPGTGSSFSSFVETLKERDLKVVSRGVSGPAPLYTSDVFFQVLP
jgi:hypothetical protein